LTEPQRAALDQQVQRCDIFHAPSHATAARRGGARPLDDTGVDATRSPGRGGCG
jgi:hypothetical protein